ncbi:glycosyltransferase [Flavobacteriaceae bacterium]|nr:glycosyltransferase [Flavobacteriaceae bacterium]
MKTKVICFIDSLNGGGAQKQIILLANGLSEKYDVSILYYQDFNFFISDIDENVHINKIISRFYFVKVFKILKFIYKENPSNIVAFLVGPSIISTLYKIFFFWRKINLVVGERNLNINGLSKKDLIYRFSHLFANKIVCNSNAQKVVLSRFFSNKKISFIPNGTNFNSPIKNKFTTTDIYKLIVPARFIEQKNPLGLLKALAQVSNVHIYWYGKIFKDFPIYNICINFINKNKLNNRFVFKKGINPIYSEIIKYDGLILPSFYEGCPNAIIDGMYCGVPILASNVSDNGIYLNHQKELLFNPHDVNDIIDKINYFKRMSEIELIKLGAENNKYARQYFNHDYMVESYNKLLI